MTDTQFRSAAGAVRAANEAGRTALIGYLPAGFPDLQTSIEAGIALAENGFDVIEVGIPYSDPVMDGPVIQDATVKALESGFRVRQVFDVVRGIVEGSGAAVVVMTYWNPVLQYGVREFATALKEAGGAGLITPDLTPEEASEWIAVSDELGLERTFLVAPSSTDQRMAYTAGKNTGFTYAVSIMGVTGARDQVADAAESVVERARVAGASPVCVGLGVSTADHVREIGAYADGAIVGTALVKALGSGGLPAAAELARELSAGAGRP